MYDHFRFNLFIFSWLSCFSLWNSPERGILLILLQVLLNDIRSIKDIRNVLFQLFAAKFWLVLFFLRIIILNLSLSTCICFLIYSIFYSS